MRSTRGYGKYASRLAALLILILCIAGAIALMGRFSHTGELSCTLSCGLIGIGLLIGVFILGMGADNDPSVLSSLFDHPAHQIDNPSAMERDKERH